MGATKRLAEWSTTAVTFESIPDIAIERAKISILDAVGTAVRGSTTDIGRTLLGYLERRASSAEAGVFGTDVRLSAPQAALANATFAHADDFDDLGGVGGHPSAVLTPTALAMGELLHANGRDVLTAWVAGYEVGTRVARALRPDRDWHPSAVCGPIGAATVASKLLGLTAAQTCHAVGIAASSAGGLKRNFGTMTKSLHLGRAAANGVEAAELAGAGWTADDAILEGRAGLADCFGGAHCDLTELTRLLGDVFLLAVDAPRVKPWPCCGGNHQALSGLLGYLAETPLDPAQIATVEHVGPRRPHTGSFVHDSVPWGLRGKFNLEYNIAAAIIDGKVDCDTFTDERAGRGDLQSFMERIHLLQHHDEVLRRAHIAGGGAQALIRITFHDGRADTIELGKADSLRGAAVVEKFGDNTGPVLGYDAVEPALAALGTLEQCDDVAQVAASVMPDRVGSGDRARVLG